MHVEYNASRAIAILVTTALLLNAMAPTLAHAATYLQGTEVNANTLIRDAYVQVTYRDSKGQERMEKGWYDSKGQERMEKGWIDEVGETSFTIRSGGIKDKKTITYDKVVSVIMSDESTVPAKQMNEVNRFIRNMGIQLEVVTVISRGQIDLQRSSKIRKGWYAHITYTSKGEEETVTGIITQHDSVHIVIRVQEEHALGILKTIAYKDINTLVISQYMQEAWKNTKQVQRYLKNRYNTKVRVQVPSIWKNQVVGRLVKVTPDTLVISRGGTFFQVPVSSISNFEVNIGQHRNTGKGFKIGLGAGAVIIGYTIIYTSKEKRQIDPRGTDPQSQHFTVAILSLWGYSAGAIVCLISTFIGATTKSDKWVKVSPQSLNLSLTPTSTKGLRAALTFNF